MMKGGGNMSVAPITPAEVFSCGLLPDKVYDVINNLLLEKYHHNVMSIVIREEDIFKLSIEKKMSDDKDTCANFFKNRNWWSDVCFAYGLAGWDVRRREPGRKFSHLIFCRKNYGRQTMPISGW